MICTGKSALPIILSDLSLSLSRSISLVLMFSLPCPAEKGGNEAAVGAPVKHSVMLQYFSICVYGNDLLHLTSVHR